MKHPLGFSIFEVVLVVFIVGLISIGGVFIYSKNRTIATLSPTSSSSQKIDNNVRLDNSGDAPSDWKRYEDPNYKFSFKYPADWVIKSGTFKPGESADGSIYYVGVDVADAYEGDGGYGIYVSDLSFDRIIRLAKGQETMHPTVSPPPTWQGLETPVKKGNYTGLQITKAQWGDKYFFTVGNKVYNFPAEITPNAEILKSETYANKIEIYNKISKSVVLH